mmetsp:Transcript_84289/g.233614  ORF Transcript_84289/g.233614 Transcript_84289/m.233614 type:complete len:307 (-) Transcript_84289:675-1595(-)
MANDRRFRSADGNAQPTEPTGNVVQQANAVHRIHPKGEDAVRLLATIAHHHHLVGLCCVPATALCDLGCGFVATCAPALVLKVCEDVLCSLLLGVAWRSHRLLAPGELREDGLRALDARYGGGAHGDVPRLVGVVSSSKLREDGLGTLNARHRGLGACGVLPGIVGVLLFHGHARVRVGTNAPAHLHAHLPCAKIGSIKCSWLVVPGCDRLEAKLLADVPQVLDLACEPKNVAFTDDGLGAHTVLPGVLLLPSVLHANEVQTWEVTQPRLAHLAVHSLAMRHDARPHKELAATLGWASAAAGQQPR